MVGNNVLTPMTFIVAVKENIKNLENLTKKRNLKSIQIKEEKLKKQESNHKLGRSVSINF
jgi:hypothetical protein